MVTICRQKPAFPYSPIRKNSANMLDRASGKELLRFIRSDYKNGRFAFPLFVSPTR